MDGSMGVRKGAWSRVEDDLLRACVEQYGEGKWHLVPMRAGLNRCRKSCRLRWLNYLKPNIKRGEFSEDEVDLMIRLHRLLGNRWSLIAGRLPGRTPNDVKNYWNTYARKKKATPPKEQTNNAIAKAKETMLEEPHHEVIKPHPRTLSKANSSSPPRWLKRTKLVSGKGEDIHGGTKQCSDEQACAATSSSVWDKSWSGHECLGNVLESGNEGENDTCYLIDKDEEEENWKKLLMSTEPNIWDEELPDVDGLGDLIMENQSWSDILLNINLWDS